MNPALGCLVPPAPWTARIVGVFGKAVSLLHPDGALVSVVGRAEHLEARAMMPAAGWEAFAAATARALDAAAGREPAMAVWDGARLVSARAAVLDLAAYEIWDPRPHLLSLATCSDDTTRSMVADRLAAMLLGAHEAAGTDEGILGSGSMARAFKARLASDRFPVSIVGFGPGTTPSGDDWIAGYLCAADIAGGAPGQAVPEFRDAVRPALDRTTAAGRSLLLGALAGAPPAYLVLLAGAVAAMARAVAAASERDLSGAVLLVAAALDAALRHGATSGEDALTGFVAGLRGSRS